MVKKPKRSKSYARRDKIKKKKSLSPVGLVLPLPASIDSLEGELEDFTDSDLSILYHESVMAMHPHLAELQDNGGLPEVAIDEFGNEWNVVAHIEFHTIVEKQLGTDEPSGIREIALKMESDGILDSHEIRHAIAHAVAEQISVLSHEEKMFDAQEYFALVEKSYQLFCDTKK